MTKHKEVKRTPVLRSKFGGSALYSVSGASYVAEEKAFIVAQDESEAAQFARTELRFEVVTAIRLESDCVYV
jgi:hypothetical protein